MTLPAPSCYRSQTIMVRIANTNKEMSALSSQKCFHTNKSLLSFALLSFDEISCKKGQSFPWTSIIKCRSGNTCWLVRGKNHLSIFLQPVQSYLQLKYAFFLWSTHIKNQNVAVFNSYVIGLKKMKKQIKSNFCYSSQLKCLEMSNSVFQTSFRPPVSVKSKKL